MKTMHLLHISALVSVSFLVVAVMSGCGGGQKTYDINTDYAGSIYGVYTQPADGDTGISTGVDVIVSWPDPYFLPPTQFTFKMEEETSSGGWTGVYTVLREEVSGTGVRTWKFVPTNYLTSNTWHRVVLTDDIGRKDTIMFRTVAAYGAASESIGKTAASGDKGSITHSVKVK